MASVLIDPDTLLADFGAAADQAVIDGWPCRLRTELLDDRPGCTTFKSVTCENPGGAGGI